MCGFVALLKKNHITIKDAVFMHQSLETLKHRGPDDQDIFINNNAFLGFNRLSINDLSTGGQPMSSCDGRFQLLFNGEIYNYLALKDQLIKSGELFKTNSEAEVLLKLYQQDGINFTKKLRGMYAILIYDPLFQKVILARDVFGIKPLYFYYDTHHLLVSSEIKLYKTLPLSDSSLNFEGIQHYFTFQYVPEPTTVLTGLSIVQPGTVVKIIIGEQPKVHRYDEIELKPSQNTIPNKTMQIKESILNSVQSHLLSDVEVGTFLSGGIDSTIVAASAKQFKQDIKAFTIGFDVKGYSEIDSARKTADFLDIDLTEITIGSLEYIKNLKKVIASLDTPLADPSVVPIFMVAELASQHVKVILSGEGSDELFGGYGIYKEPNALACFSNIPNGAKKALLNLAKKMPPKLRGRSFIQRGCTPLFDRYVGNAFVFNEEEKEKLLKFYDGDTTFKDVTHPLFQRYSHLDKISQMQSLDMQTWLRGDILVKSDRLTMAHSLELRVPFLDVEVLEIAKTLTPLEKVTGKTTKYLLRESFTSYL